MRVKNRKMIGPNIARIQQANSEARMPEITKRTPVLCIYHDDLDGLAAAAVLQYFIGKDEEIVYHAMNHGDKYPAVECDQKVYILDFPLPEKFAECWGITHNIVWIDHHKSAIEEAQDIRVPGVREIGYPAASELTWEWFSGKECHLAIKMVSDRDSWNNKILNSGAFCLGMGLCLTKGYEGAPGPIWEEILSHSDSKSLNKIIENGKIIEKYLEEKNKEYCKTFSFRTIFRFDGSVYKCIVCNKGRTSSNLFDQTDKREYDIMVTWVFDGKRFRVSLYAANDDVDVSEIAKSFPGGGGHAGAAGFSCERLHMPAEFLNLTKEENN